MTENERELLGCLAKIALKRLDTMDNDYWTIRAALKEMGIEYDDDD